MERTRSSPRRLLLIDDHPPFRLTLTQRLWEAGHRLWEAGEGSAGLVILRTELPDLVVTDRDMPGLTGWDVAWLVKATHPRLPVVLVTGGADTRAADRRERAFVGAILWKTFQFTELLALIGRLTGGGASFPVARAGRSPAGSGAESTFRDDGRESGAPERPRRGTRRARDAHKGVNHGDDLNRGR